MVPFSMKDRKESFSYIRSDQDFVLKQIKVSEDHALFKLSGGTQGKSLFGPSVPIPPGKLSWDTRTVDATPSARECLLSVEPSSVQTPDQQRIPLSPLQNRKCE